MINTGRSGSVRIAGLVVLVVISGVFLPACTQPQSSATLDTSSLEMRIHELTNIQRNGHGLPSLSYDAELSATARSHSQDMAANNYFEHADLRGIGSSAGYSQASTCRRGSLQTIGENIFKTNHTTTRFGVQVNDFNSLENIAKNFVDVSVNNPGYSKNTLSAAYDREGVGVGIAPDKSVYITVAFC